MSTTLAVGSVLKGRYRLERMLSKGGMSAVFLATDVTMRKPVVVKQTTRGEIELLAKLSHAGIVAFLDSFSYREEENSPFTHILIEECIRGETISAYVKTHGAFPVSVCLSLAAQLCSVLRYLHAQKPPIIYRDLKPENILLQAEGSLCLIDFGIAREYVPHEDSDTTPFGTKGYAPPEQYAKSLSQSDVRSDIYALGKVLFFLLTAKHPRDKENEKRSAFCAFVKQHIKNPHMAQIILTCTEEDPEKRYASIEEVIYALQSAEQTKGREHMNKEKRVRKSCIAALLTVVGILVYAIGLLWGIAKGFPSPEPLHTGLQGFAWITAFFYWFAAFGIGSLFLGLSRALHLLEKLLSRH